VPFPSSHLPPETPAERIRELLAELPPESPLKVGLSGLVSPTLGLGAVLGAPVSGSVLALTQSLSTVIATWIGSQARAQYTERIQEILWRMVEEIDRIRVSSQPLKTDAEWAELVCSVLPVAARATTEAKRAAFARLLARGASYSEMHDHEEARTMAALLDQLEYDHVRVLSEVMKRARSFAQDPFWGKRLDIPIEQEHFSQPGSGAALLRLQAIGFLEIVDTKTRRHGSLNKAVVVSHLGTRFARWVTA